MSSNIVRPMYCPNNLWLLVNQSIKEPTNLVKGVHEKSLLLFNLSSWSKEETFILDATAFIFSNVMTFGLIS